MDKLTVCTWNLRRATSDSDLTCSLINEIAPNILCLQEVNSWPSQLKSKYSILSRQALTKEGNKQIFHTMILVKCEIGSEIQLISTFDSLNQALSIFNGNLIAAKTKLESGLSFNILSAYSPAWPIDTWIPIEDRGAIKLDNSADLWLTELLWESLKKSYNNNPWIIAGDLNASTTFDESSHMPHGNQEILDRMLNLGYIECLFNYNKKLIPTFQNANNKKVIHQIDHLFTSSNLYDSLTKCYVLDGKDIFEKGISDHLPIIAEFNQQSLQAQGLTKKY